MSLALQCSVNAFSHLLKCLADKLLRAVLNRFSQQDIFDYKLLLDTARCCDLSTLQLVLNYSFGISMADGPILNAVTENLVYGMEIMKFLLQKCESEANITQQLFYHALWSQKSGVFALLVDTHVEHAKITLNTFMRLRNRHVLDTIV